MQIIKCMLSQTILHEVRQLRSKPVQSLTLDPKVHCEEAKYSLISTGKPTEKSKVVSMYSRKTLLLFRDLVENSNPK